MWWWIIGILVVGNVLFKDKGDLAARVAELTRACAESACQAVMGGPV